MEEEKMMMMDDTSPSWKLYENPFYINPPHYRKNPHKSPINRHLQFYCLKLGSSSSSFCDLVPTKRTMDSELDLARSQIVELKAELRYERKARKKVECLAKRLAKELDDERKQREAIEELCEELAREISSHEAQIDLMKKEIEDERKMLRLAEVLREERVQMKLAEVKMVFEDMISELQLGTNNNNNNNTAAAAATFSDSITHFSGKLKQTAAADNAVGEGSEAAVRLSCQMEIPARRVSPEVENNSNSNNNNNNNNNPHIMRGIKGFVEFRRVVRTAAKGLKSGDSDAKLECQKAQLKVLLKHNVRSNNPLIIT